MTGRVLRRLNDLLARVLPERRIYIRSDAHTKLVSLNPVTQFGLVALTAALVGWSAYASLAYVSVAMDGRTAEHRLETMREAYEIRLDTMREQQIALETELTSAVARGDAVTRELSDKQHVLIQSANNLNSAERELHGLRGRFEAVLAERQRTKDRINALNEEVVALRLSLAAAEQTADGLASSLSTFSGTMGEVIAQRDTATRRSGELDQRVATLRTEIARWEVREKTLIAQLEEAARISFGSLEKVFSNSDLDLDSILNDARRDFSGQGGPYEPIDDESSSNAGDDDVRIAALMTDMERVNLMRLAVDKLPFGIPARDARRTSGFGPRRDPFRRRYSHHNGIDFAGPTGTPIYTTADGVVTFSGRQSGYGIVVKIRHAFGFETVYAHLNRSRVKVGQRVERGDRIADMGSTGRSTGSHLHYEIRIDSKPVNPSKFIRAARNVL